MSTPSDSLEFEIKSESEIKLELLKDDFKSLCSKHPVVYGMYIQSNNCWCPSYFREFYVNLDKVDYLLTTTGNSFTDCSGVEWKAYIVVIKTSTLTIEQLLKLEF